MANPARFPFIMRGKGWGKDGLAPFVPLLLASPYGEIEVMALLDTGSATNVLPYQAGLDLGALWERQPIVPSLAGSLQRIETRGLIVTGTIADFAPAPLAFAWTRSDDHPVILGQRNFFMEFDVFFSRSREFFEIQPKQKI